MVELASVQLKVELRILVMAGTAVDWVGSIIIGAVVVATGAAWIWLGAVFWRVVLAMFIGGLIGYAAGRGASFTEGCKTRKRDEEFRPAPAAPRSP